ncbi:MAG: hypothetical protein AMXMBFR64_09250 [Myxococcales bacterium]
MTTWRQTTVQRAEVVDAVILRTPATPQYRGVLVSTARELAGQGGIDVSGAEDLARAVGEAFDNATAHAYRRIRDGAVEVRFYPGESRIIVEVVDRGDGFPYRLLIQGRGDDVGDACGLRRMQQLVDEVSIRPNLPRGTVVTLVKNGQ